MRPNRYNFVDPRQAPKEPPSVWLTRSIITGLIAGLGAAAYALGYLPL